MKWSNGGCFRSSFLPAFFLVALAFTCMTLPLAAQQKSDSQQKSVPSNQALTAPMQLLLQADAKLTLLNQQIPILQDQINGLQAALATLNAQLTDSETASSLLKKQLQDSQQQLAQSEAARASLQTLLVMLKSSYDEQSKDLEAIQGQAQTVISDYDKELKGERAKTLGWKIGGSVLIVAVAVLGGYEGGKALRWW